MAVSVFHIELFLYSYYISLFNELINYNGSIWKSSTVVIDLSLFLKILKIFNDIRYCDPSCFVFLSQNCCSYLGSLWFHVNFWTVCSIPVKYVIGTLIGTGEHYAKWNKPGGEGQMPYDLTFNWNVINKTNKQAKYKPIHWN